jgi:hypothetical protein
MPILLEAEQTFAALYPDIGRGCWSVGRMLAILLLEHLEDLDDQRALDALSFDARWQYALGLEPSEAYLSRRALVDFRSRLASADPEGKLLRNVFDRVCAAALVALKVSTSRQRLDSTLICSNIRERGRVSLASEVLRRFVRELTERQRGLLPEDLRAWFDRRPADWEQTTSKLSTEQVGGWLGAAIAAFAEDAVVREYETYGVMVRLLTEHVALRPETDEDDHDATEAPAFAARPSSSSPSPETAAEPHQKATAKHKTKGKGQRKATAKHKKKGKRRRKATRQKKARFWSIHDPDASFGHKGLGYHAHVTETCGNSGTEIITDYDLVTAAQSDVGMQRPALDRLEARGLLPADLLVDGGYVTADGLLEARARGTELVGPVHRSRMPVETMSRADFEITSDEMVLRCPAGHAPTRHGLRQTEQETSSEQVTYAFFDATTCQDCPARARCPVRTPNHAKARVTRLELSPQLIARDRRWAEQHTEAWRATYALRSGIESTMHELKKGHGFGRLRVRGKARSLLQVALKTTACNIKRWARAATRPTRADPSHTPSRPHIGLSAAMSACRSLLGVVERRLGPICRFEPAAA